MAEVETNQDHAQGIKLFGKTITLHDKQVKDGDKRDDDQTAEKRPEKIIPCPRCKSMETKFCYFNNYNVKQPRHFCKGCQRYWTAGGALRNVPIGAGRRKAKSPCQNNIGGLPGSYLHEPLSSVAVHQFQLDGVVEDWKVMISHGSFRQALPVKRRRDGYGGQTC